MSLLLFWTVICCHILDGGITYVGIKNFNLAELNDHGRWFMAKIGLVPGIVAYKAIHLSLFGLLYYFSLFSGFWGMTLLGFLAGALAYVVFQNIKIISKVSTSEIQSSV